MWPAGSARGLLECGSRHFLPAGQTLPEAFQVSGGVTQTLPRHTALVEGCFTFLCRFAAFLLQIFKYSKKPKNNPKPQN